MVRNIIIGLIVVVSLMACGGKENYVPKPSTYLALNMPEREYATYTDDCGYTFNKPSYFKVNKAPSSPCNRDIEFQTLDGVLHLSRIDMDTSLAAYVDYSLDKIEEHKVRATAIYDSIIIREDAKVYGTFFELQGNVASPFQFYLTDSTDRFVSGVVYFNTRPNYDSLRPVLEFVKKDILEMMETIEWTE